MVIEHARPKAAANVENHDFRPRLERSAPGNEAHVYLRSQRETSDPWRRGRGNFIRHARLPQAFSDGPVPFGGRMLPAGIQRHSQFVAADADQPFGRTVVNGLFQHC